MLKSQSPQMRLELGSVDVCVPENNILKCLNGSAIGPCRNASIDKPLVIDKFVRQIDTTIASVDA